MVALRIGTLADDPEASAELLSHRFNRHTFWCGQSGSGKTYALGVLLEQLILETGLPVVVFDPNADFVRFAETHRGGPEADEWATRDVRVLRAATDDLRVRFATLPIATKAAILRLDPVLDGALYNAMIHLEEMFAEEDPSRVVPELFASEDPALKALALRVENLGVLDWSVWAYGQEAATEVIATRPDATVLDLGGFSNPREQFIVALSVLEDLWAKREERRPVLLVIDEAHNLCSPELEGPLAVRLRDQIIQIAAEGRKFGLWLLLSTQRPSRIHPSILSQCDNLAMMKMTSPNDLDELRRIFGYAPDELMKESPWFRQGQALFAGGFIEEASLVQMGERLTVEGGYDVRVPERG